MGGIRTERKTFIQTGINGLDKSGPNTTLISFFCFYSDLEVVLVSFVVCYYPFLCLSSALTEFPLVHAFLDSNNTSSWY